MRAFLHTQSLSLSSLPSLKHYTLTFSKDKDDRVHHWGKYPSTSRLSTVAAGAGVPHKLAAVAAAAHKSTVGHMLAAVDKPLPVRRSSRTPLPYRHRLSAARDDTATASWVRRDLRLLGYCLGLRWGKGGSLMTFL